MTDRQKEILAKTKAGSTAARSSASTVARTGALMSEETESSSEEDKYDPVFIPENFKKTRPEKVND